jgi:hypothetical protein
VIGRFPGETSCLTMAWAVMDLVIAGSRDLGLTRCPIVTRSPPSSRPGRSPRRPRRSHEPTRAREPLPSEHFQQIRGATLLRAARPPGRLTPRTRAPVRSQPSRQSRTGP